MTLALAWARAFAVTLVIELAVVLAMTRDDIETRSRRTILVVFANLVTHPIVWFVIPAFVAGTWTQLFVCEAWAVLAEALFYGVTMRLRGSRALAISAIANAASYGVGVILRATTHWI
jgi:hypothetical protein